jgi:hypothetical protein
MAGLRNLKAQSVLEYFITYSWAIAIILVVLTVIYAVFFASQLFVQLSCNFDMYFGCENGAVVSNALGTSVLLLASNAQQYPVAGANVIVNISGVGPVQGPCKPGYVLPGGLLVCEVSMSNRLAVGSTVNAELLLSEYTCADVNQSVCAQGTLQHIEGTFQSRVLPSFNFTPFTISLVPSSNSVDADGTRDLLTATATFLGYPLRGASVNFSESQAFPNMGPVLINTNADGKALSYISSLRTGVVTVNAIFLGYTANTVISFVKSASPTGGSSIMQTATSSTSSASSTSLQCSFQQAVRQGDLIVVGMAIADPASQAIIQTLSDSDSYQFASIASQSYSSPQGATSAKSWYAKATSTSAETITVSYSKGPAGLFCYELTPPYSTGGITSSTGGGQSLAASVAQYTPSAGSSVIAVVGAVIGGSGGITPGSGYTQSDYQQPVSTDSEYQLGSSGSTASQFTLTSSQTPPWSEVSVAIPPS